MSKSKTILIVSITTFFTFIIVGVAWFFINGSNLFLSQNEKAVNETLNYLNKHKGDHHFKLQYWYSMQGRQFFLIEDWSLNEYFDYVDSLSIVEATGKTKNGFGVEMPITINFLVKDGKISDTKGLFYFKLDLDLTDYEKFLAIQDVRNKVVIEKQNVQYGYYGDSMEGKALIYNGSSVPVEYIKLKITYHNNAGAITQTDDTYAVSGVPLMPGERRQISWYTSPCYNCPKYKLQLDFENYQ